MALLSRVADRVYWGARQMERAEDTARIMRAFSDVFIDFPMAAGLSWEPLVAISGSAPLGDVASSDRGEAAVVRFIIDDAANPGSIRSSVEAARENLRTTREVMPREAWSAVNQLALFVRAEATGALDRRRRDRVLARVVEISRRLDGVLESTMTRDAAYRMWRLGRLMERVDMTTRVIGVRAATLMQSSAHGPTTIDEVQWMGVLRSLSALQMYQRAVRGPIDASDVLGFLLHHEGFPRSVRGCLSAIRAEVIALPAPGPVLDALSIVEHTLASVNAEGGDGAALDDRMDRLQIAIADVDRAIISRYVRW